MFVLLKNQWRDKFMTFKKQKTIIDDICLWDFKKEEEYDFFF